nr:MAG TPA: hypothetical protein [Caudoviricetes sp.]
MILLYNNAIILSTFFIKNYCNAIFFVLYFV